MNYTDIYKKYKNIIPYLFFGVCTTSINIFTYWLCSHLLNIPVMISTIIAWVFAVLFAYVTNRRWVFHSQVSSFYNILQEIIKFFACRIATGMTDWLLMWLFVTQLCFDDVIIKTLANIIVIVFNYLASKMIVFKKELRL